jgi:hypothetical protein
MLETAGEVPPSSRRINSWLVEAAGVEPKIDRFSNLLMARDF